MLKLTIALLAFTLSSSAMAAPIIASESINLVDDYWLEPNPDWTGGFFDPEPEYLTHTYISEVRHMWESTATIQEYTFAPELNNLHTVEIDYTFSVSPTDVVTMLWGWDDLQAGVRVTDCVGDSTVCNAANVGTLYSADLIYSDDNTQYFNASPLTQIDFMVGTQIDRVPLWNEYYGYDTPSSVPVPAAAWLFSSALLGLGVVRRRKFKQYS